MLRPCVAMGVRRLLQQDGNEVIDTKGQRMFALFEGGVGEVGEILFAEVTVEYQRKSAKIFQVRRQQFLAGRSLKISGKKFQWYSSALNRGH